ncbi:FtsW/RodA/SpoVE family cell cycle protein [Listeria booriae]|uniref:Probable peptidoglycan glycosyltransferase FtsW n=1 Tax=Listeria booriae TaxID=1552123 RepID=A0A7X0XDV8_9LIST|nr:FtsW/RodA/SpoVE family cell cycle protein [Listeria booriae]MBC1492237.1 FtsW/RodA/SpoVE family cell cycle protein [Listeria booriae]MBC1525101.1 FtsW/RodA/SpoVE family cell cycle protein [Listeria booriae]
MLTKNGRLIILVYLVTAIWSCLMVYSASYAPAILRYETVSYHFALRQAFFFGVGLALIFLFASLNSSAFCNKKTMKVAGGITVLLLLLVLVTGSQTNNAQRWIEVSGIVLQPTELVKGLLILVTANFIVIYFRYMDTNRVIYLLAGFIFFCALLIIMQPDLGTSFIVIVIFIAQIITSGIPGKQLARLAATFISLTALVATAIYFLYPSFLTTARLGRFAFLDPFNEANLDASYQLRNGYYSIASGGITGRGFGNSIQKLGFLPESHTDFISAVISEELGAPGFLITLALIFFFIWQAFRIALQSHSPFDTSICIGIATWIAIQTSLNLGGVLGLIPLTGVPLPFISYGGTSILSLACCTGFLIAADRRNQKERRIPQ